LKVLFLFHSRAYMSMSRDYLVAHVGAAPFKIPHVEVRRVEEERPDGRVSGEQAVLFDVGFLDGLDVWGALEAQALR